MSTRITTGMISGSLISDLNDVYARLAHTQRVMSSGKEITRPSDDPFGATRALGLQGELTGVTQRQRNVQDGQGFTEVSDAALGSIGDAILRVRELVVSAGSDASGAAARAAAADEIDQLTEAVKSSANTQYAGQYVFAGTKTTTLPYGAADAYQGDTGTIAREIGPGVSVQVNADLSAVLGSGTAAADGKLLDRLRAISAHLRGNTAADGQALRTTDLDGLDAGHDALLALRSQMGATDNRLQAAATRLTDLESTTTKLLSDTQDADMAKTLTDFSTQQTVYQSALRAGASIVQASLLDFLK